MKLKKNYILLAALFTLLTVPAAAQRERVNFDSRWRFAFGNAADPMKDFGCGTEYFNYLTKANSIHNMGPYAPSFKEDDRWRTVDLPFDFVVDLPFAKEASYSHGHKTVGWKYPETSVGWYRKSFHLPSTDRGKRISIQFDGIFRDARVWVNGFLVGREPSGYAHQNYDITPYLFFGTDSASTNVVCVRADATYEEGWFYEGGGIYRHTWITKTHPVHVANDGVFVHSRLYDNYTKACVYIDAEVANDQSQELHNYDVEFEVVDNSGKVVGSARAEGARLKPRQQGLVSAMVSLDNPRLWSVDSPTLYKVVTKVFVNGNEVDRTTTRTGIREIKMDKDRGLLLNGTRVELKGFNMHQDHAGVGSGIPDGLQVYRIKQLKAIGANAYRASHNPMTTEMLDVCDSLGMLVFEENRLLGINNFEMDVARNMIRHDRNHPCVFLWGIGNEEWGVEWDERSVDIARTMTEMCHLADSTRLVGVATSSGPQIIKGAHVAGYNYILQNPIDQHRKDFPERLALGSEETSGCGTRGVYFNEKEDVFNTTTAKKDEAQQLEKANPSGRMPSMNLFPDKEGTVNRIERGWKFYAERPWLMGLFYWTGFDYRGEPSPLQWPATGSQFGVLDYCGFPKDEAYYLKAWWKSQEPLVHVLPHWNLQGHEGKDVKVMVYGNCEEVELRINGKSQGRKAMPLNGHLTWTVVYQPGKIEAIGYNKGKKVAVDLKETSGEAKQIKIDSHKEGNIYVCNISLHDAKLRFVPTANLPMTVKVCGDARILGYGNGDSAFQEKERPTDDKATALDIKSFNGRAQVIIQSETGKFTLSVTGNNLKQIRK